MREKDPHHRAGRDVIPREQRPRLPEWLKRPLAEAGGGFGNTAGEIGEARLATICEEAKCPNRSECWSRGTATFLILGSICTRRCGFCSVATGRPNRAPDADEPRRVAEAATALGLYYVVVTSVDRDDLPDAGAGHFRTTVLALREAVPGVGIELLTPDFQGHEDVALETLADLGPMVWGHNVETVPRLYPIARPTARYQGSLTLLERAGKLRGVQTKSAIMLGLGERDDEVRDVLRDLRSHGVARVAIGQYLQPTPTHLPVREFVTPERFDRWRDEALAMGFVWVKAGPFVRSSYHAEEDQAKQDQEALVGGRMPAS